MEVHRNVAIKVTSKYEGFTSKQFNKNSNKVNSRNYNDDDDDDKVERKEGMSVSLPLKNTPNILLELISASDEVRNHHQSKIFIQITYS